MIDPIRISIDPTKTGVYRWRVVSDYVFLEGHARTVMSCLDAIKKALAGAALGPQPKDGLSVDNPSKTDQAN